MVLKVLTVDIGTTNVKAAVVDERGRILKVSSRELKLLTPEPGAAEHSPQEIVRAVGETAKLAAKRLEVDAVALTCYQHGLMLVDREGRPITNALTHMDSRSGPYAARVEELCDPRELYERTGCPPLFVYALPKILWFKARRPNIAREAKYFLLVKDYLVLNAVGEPYIDYGNASGSQLFNIRQLRWDDLALEIAGIAEDRLATPAEGAEVLCLLKGRGAELFGVNPGTPLVLGTFDGAGQNFGYLIEKPELAVVNLGTTAVLRALAREPLLDIKGMRVFCYYAAAGRWAFGGSTNNGGSVLRWFRDVLGAPETIVASLLEMSPYDLLTREAELAPPGSGGLMFLPFMAGERFPFRDPYSRGVLLGLRYDHRKCHIVRAFMEGVAMVLKSILLVLEELGVAPKVLVGGGGGLRSRLWAEIIANATCKQLLKVRGGEYASNKGAAALAFKALGAVKNLQELGWELEVEERVTPRPELCALYKELYREFMEAYETLAPLFRKWSTASLPT